MTFAVRRNNSTIHRVSTLPPAADSLSISAILDGNGSISLSVNHDEPAITKTPGPLPSHPQEDLSISHDVANPVDDQSPAQRFDGVIDSLIVTITRESRN